MELQKQVKIMSLVLSFGPVLLYTLAHHRLRRTRVRRVRQLLVLFKSGQTRLLRALATQALEAYWG